jgi:glycosyltransferase involved in cell wall biosynthesis
MKHRTKMLLWTYIPTHHQSAFLQALRDDGVDLIVHYFKRVSAARVRLGWADPAVLPGGERLVQPKLTSLDICADWRERVHVIPGYGSLFLLRLAFRLSREHVQWMNWSEPSRHWFRWYFTYPMKRAYAALINRHSVGALAIGAMAREDFRRWGVSERLIRFLPYSSAGLAASECPSAIAAPRGSPQFTFVGALCHRKGIDLLLRAFQIVLREHSEARLRLVGFDESQGAYNLLADQLGISHGVDFTGSVPAAEVADSLAGCDVLILPSRFDGWGMVVNEAASLGKALIATDACGSAHHLVRPEVNGFRVRHGDHLTLAEAMRRYCSEPDLARRHGDHSREIFLQFTPTRNARRMRECLSSLRAPEVQPQWEQI